MAYLGNNLQVAYPSYRVIDDISSQFNGSLKTFALKVGGSTPIPFPINPQQCLISVNNIVQKPDSTGVSGFTLTGSNIVFVTAPTSGWSFFGTVLAGADYVNAGANFPSGTAAVPGITFDQSTGTGLFLASANVLGIATNGVQQLTVDSNGNLSVANVISSAAGTATNPGLKVGTGTTYAPGIYSPGTDQLAISSSGQGRLYISSSGLIGVNQSSPGSALDVAGEIRIYPTSGAGNLRFGSAGVEKGKVAVDASSNYIVETAGSERLRITSAGLVGVGTSSPSTFGAQLAVLGGSVHADRNIGGAAAQVQFSMGASSGANFGQIGNTGTRWSLGYGSTANTIGTEVLTWNSSGNVGIGVSGPSKNLDIASSYRLQIDTANALYGPAITMGGDNGTSQSGAQIVAGYEGNWGLSFRLSSNSQTGYSSDPSLLTYATKMRLTSTGLGIGTTSPSSSLVVSNGGANGIEFGPVNGDIFTYNRSTSAYTNTQITCNEFVVRTNGSNERARIDSSGRLLVGTSTARSNFYNTTATAQIQVEGVGAESASFAAINVAGNAGGARLHMAKGRGGTIGSNTIVSSGDVLGQITFQGNDGSEFVEGATIEAQVDGTPGANDMPGRLVFSTTADGAASPTERMRITQNGLFQFGTTNLPIGVHEFNWQGANRMAFNNKDSVGTNCYGLVINYTNAAPNNTGSEFIYCQDNVSQRFSARSNGGLANYSANNANLSDRNVKKDISPAADTWNCIKDWEIVNYRYKDQPDDADLNLGVIAQQVAESCPEVITVFQQAKEATDDKPAQEERLGVKEQQMYWMAIKALQEAQVRIEALEADVAQLKGA
jgi:hypothetical protein